MTKNSKQLKKDNTWKKIRMFALLMVAVNVLFNILIIARGGGIENNIPYAIVLIFSPAIISLVVTYMFERNVRGFGWKWSNAKLYIVSYLIPIAYITLGYGLVLLLGFGALNMEKIHELGWVELLMIPTLGITGVLLQVLGEEIGWRGFLLPQLLKKMSFTKASLIVGAAWAVFHYPLILFADFSGGKTPVIFALICFTIAIMGANMAINWLYVQSGSIWAAVIFHATHNSILNDIHPLVIDTPITPYLLTEFGVVLAVLLCVVGVFFWTRRGVLSQGRA